MGRLGGVSFTLFAAADPTSPQPCRFGFTRTAEWQSEAARKDAAATTASRGESVNQHTSRRLTLYPQVCKTFCSAKTPVSFAKTTS